MNGGYRGRTHPFYDHNLYRYDIAAAHWEIVVHDNFPSMVNNDNMDEQQTLFFTAGYSSKNYNLLAAHIAISPKKPNQKNHTT